MKEMAFRRVARGGEVPAGTVLEVELGQGLLALCNVGGELRAVSGVCPHSGGPLGQGTLHGESIMCPWHMWPFDSRTGACDFNPDLRVPVFPVHIEGEDVFVDLPDA